MSASNYDCHCFLPYPNYHHKKKNGKWKCVDDMECVRDYIPNKSWNCATHCIKKNRAERKGGDDMQDYKEIAKKMQDEAIVKAGCGKYVIYRKDWLYEHIEQEYVLIKSAKEMKPIKDGITRLREYLKEQESKKNMKVFAEFDTYEEAAEYAQANLDGRYDIQPALHIKKQIWKFAILVPDEADID